MQSVLPLDGCCEDLEVSGFKIIQSLLVFVPSYGYLILLRGRYLFVTQGSHGALHHATLLKERDDQVTFQNEGYG